MSACTVFDHGVRAYTVGARETCGLPRAAWAAGPIVFRRPSGETKWIFRDHAAR